MFPQSPIGYLPIARLLYSEDAAFVGHLPTVSQDTFNPNPLLFNIWVEDQHCGQSPAPSPNHRPCESATRHPLLTLRRALSFNCQALFIICGVPFHILNDWAPANRTGRSSAKSILGDTPPHMSFWCGVVEGVVCEPPFARLRNHWNVWNTSRGA